MKRIAIARKLRAQIHEFLGIFYPHFSKPKGLRGSGSDLYYTQRE
jgi:hypothetical protein